MEETSDLLSEDDEPWAVLPGGCVNLPLYLALALLTAPQRLVRSWSSVEDVLEVQPPQTACQDNTRPEADPKQPQASQEQATSLAERFSHEVSVPRAPAATLSSPPQGAGKQTSCSSTAQTTQEHASIAQHPAKCCKASTCDTPGGSNTTAAKKAQAQDLNPGGKPGRATSTAQPLQAPLGDNSPGGSSGPVRLLAAATFILGAGGWGQDVWVSRGLPAAAGTPGPLPAAQKGLMPGAGEGPPQEGHSQQGTQQGQAGQQLGQQRREKGEAMEQAKESQRSQEEREREEGEGQVSSLAANGGQSRVSSVGAGADPALHWLCWRPVMVAALGSACRARLSRYQARPLPASRPGTQAGTKALGQAFSKTDSQAVTSASAILGNKVTSQAVVRLGEGGQVPNAGHGSLEEDLAALQQAQAAARSESSVAMVAALKLRVSEQKALKAVLDLCEVWAA
ncbi:hypothetical protein V8C86DRAFT_890730 [Haematococcus lacustris]